MNSVQEILANSLFPPPCSPHNFAAQDRTDLPTNKDNINPNPGYFNIDTNQLPERCQFTFSDGRQCRMQRSEIHPRLCRFHKEREEQELFGSQPSYDTLAALGLPELEATSRDLTTCTGINRSLAQVFRLLAQRRISRQEAVAFGYLAQLMLQTISAARAESVDPIRSSSESHQRDELSPVNKVVPSEHREPRRAVYAPDGFAGDLSFSSPQREANAAPASRAQADDATSIVIPSDGPERGISPAPPVNIVGPGRGAQFEPPMPSRGTSSPVNDVIVDERPLGEPLPSTDHQSLRSRSLGVAHAASPPNSQLSQSEQMRRTRLQLTQNEHLQNLDT